MITTALNNYRETNTGAREMVFTFLERKMISSSYFNFIERHFKICQYFEQPRSKCEENYFQNIKTSFLGWHIFTTFENFNKTER